MNITFNSGTGGVSGGNETPSANEVKGFQDGLAGKSDQELLQGLMQGNLPKWQEQAIKDEINKRHPQPEQSDGASGTGSGSGKGGADELDDLIKKLKNGTISDEEIKKLSKLSGIPEDQLQQAKGKNSADSLGQDSDITGG